MQNIVNQLLDAFTDLPRITKSHTLTANAPIWIDVPTGQFVSANETKLRLKHSRPISSKDKNPRKRKGANDQNSHNVEASKKESQDIIIDETSKEVQVPENDENEEISISYVTTRKRWNRKDTVVDNIFAYNIAVEI